LVPQNGRVIHQATLVLFRRLKLMNLQIINQNVRVLETPLTRQTLLNNIAQEYLGMVGSKLTMQLMIEAILDQNV
jgi:hypothetical protein